MTLDLSDEERLIAETARAFFTDKSPVRALRTLRDTKDPAGYSRDLWREMAALGWAGFLVPELWGGVGAGIFGLGLVLEEAGRTLAASPLLSTALIGASALSLAQREVPLRRVIAGECLVALALEEGPHHAPYRIDTLAKRQGAGFRLDGEKRFVLDGHVADLLLIAARTSGAREARAGITLFLAPARQPGITLTRTSMLDSRNAALVRLEGVVLDTQHIIGEIDGGSDLLDPVLDRARVGVASEMLGAMSEAFERTLKYLKERVQFGVPIGSFQALKHRAAQMFAEIELTRSAVRAGLRAIDEGLAEAPALASLAKAKAGEAMLLIANEAVQMHGGIGMTDEHEIGFFLKRARVAEASFGNTAFHRDRYAALMGY